jgi:Ni,Fe-hydrogenase III large subunit
MRGVVEPGPPGELWVRVPLGSIDRAASLVAEHGGRLVTLLVVDRPGRSLLVAFAARGELVVLRAPLSADARAFPSLALSIPGALWCERELHDRHGLEPLGHPDLDAILEPDADAAKGAVHGSDAFMLPYGPIRSGIFESIQFVIDTAGEDVLALRTRPFFKRRELEARFAGASLEHGAFVAERVAGIASVAHSVAYAHAVERALDLEVPVRARWWRLVYAELERMANHLDVAAKEAEAAALVVGHARMTILKEDVLRLQARLTGSRFARGMVRPGGVRAEGGLAPDDLRAAVDRLERELRRDRSLLLRTTSFTDRLIGSGTLDRATVEGYGGVGPVARGSGVSTDARFERPYGAYDHVGFEVPTRDAGDAMARIEVRFAEVAESLHLVRQGIDQLARRKGPLRTDPPSATAAAFGWAEAPQGELVYRVAVDGDRLESVAIASPSLRNWALFAESFRGDVLTDFAFIEHSFGITPAGADR